MEHLTSASLLIATLTGCGISDAFIAGLPVGGQAGAPNGSAILGSVPASVPIVTPSNTTASTVMPIQMSSASAGSAGHDGASGSTAPPALTPQCRPTKYSLALRLTIDVSWTGTIALIEGAGKAYTWTKLTIEPAANIVSEFRTCGSLFPVLRGTAVAGNTSSFQQVPLASYDLPTMPAVAGGSAMRVGSALTLFPGTLVIGLDLPDPAGPWPTASTDPTLMPIDADGDSKLGVTQLVRHDAMFTAIPTSILQTESIDATYVANRLAFRATLDDPGCAVALEGTAELLAYDMLTLGCHVQDRDDCRAEELAFITDGAPQFKFRTAAVAHARVVPVDASCAEAVKVLEVPGP